jgi:outer membrane protein assembly factor BamD
VRRDAPDDEDNVTSKHTPTRSIPLALAFGAALALAGCGGQKDKYVERSVNELYNTAVDQLEQENYKTAAKVFDEVERQHPYSAWATKAQLMAGFAYYQANNYDDAIVALDRFIQLHPGHKDVAYAYYLKGLCYYERISDVERDQSTTQRALDTLQEVVRRFPDTAYARDARLKIDLTRDHLAGKEMEIGRFYLGRGDNLAAVNRFRRVVDDYQTTTQVPEALHRLVEAYLRLGMKEEARKAAAVLGHNYPGSEWYIDSYGLMAGDVPKQQAKSFWGRLF